MESSGSGSFPVQQLPNSLGARHVKRSEDPPQCSSKSFSNTSLFLCWTITSLRIITSLLTSVQNSLFIHFLRFVERYLNLLRMYPFVTPFTEFCVYTEAYGSSPWLSLLTFSSILCLKRLQELDEVCPPGFAYQSLPNLQGDGFWILAQNDSSHDSFPTDSPFGQRPV